MRKAFEYSFANLLQGDFPDWQLSPLMRAWRGKTVSRRGAALAADAASRLNGLGWTTRTEIQVTELLGRRLDRDYGDFDVLAWHREARRVLVVECKDVRYSKTGGKIAEQLAGSCLSGCFSKPQDVV